MTDWHLIHLGQLALSGAALLTIEATAVLPEGRITYADVGLWSDETEAAMGRVLSSIRRYSDMPFANSARARRTQGLDRGSLEGRRTDRRQWRDGRRQWRDGMARGRAFGACVPAERDPAGRAGPRRDGANPRRLRASGEAGGAAGHSGGANSRRARLFAASVSVAAVEYPRRRIRRRFGEPDAFSAGGVRRGSRQLSRRSPGQRPRFGNGLGRRRLGHRPDDRLRQSARSAGMLGAFTSRAEG